MIRKFNNAIYNAWYSGVTLYRCTLSVSATDPQGDDVGYRILYGTNPLLTGATTWNIPGTFSSGATATTAIPLGPVAAAETLYYWKARGNIRAARAVGTVL